MLEIWFFDYFHILGFFVCVLIFYGTPFPWLFDLCWSSGLLSSSSRFLDAFAFRFVIWEISSASASGSSMEDLKSNCSCDTGPGNWKDSGDCGVYPRKALMQGEFSAAGEKSTSKYQRALGHPRGSSRGPFCITQDVLLWTVMIFESDSLTWKCIFSTLSGHVAKARLHSHVQKRKI